MLTLLVAAMLAQGSTCEAALARARTAYARLDTNAAVVAAEAAARQCPTDEAQAFLRGLVAARAASAVGGSDASLAPVFRAVDELAVKNDAGGPAEIASLVLRAAAAAAQSERGEMSAYLAQALQLERGRASNGLRGAPVATAHEVAAELWLQVHRYDEASAAFELARVVSGDSLRTTLGLARARAGQQQARQACQEYERFVSSARPLAPALATERGEAQRYLTQAACRIGTGP
jgi:hypothetical protein